MSAVRPWVVVVIADPAKVAAKTSPGSIEEPASMLQRACTLTSAERVCCVIADSFRQGWAAVYDPLQPSNRYSLLAGEPVVKGLARCLKSVETQDSKANVIVIPYNHCAVEEVSWLDSTKGALRLGSTHRNTVYLLHDNPDNDPRVALQKPEVCTSSVMVGTSAALLSLCLGNRATTVVDLIADSREDSGGSSTEDVAITESPLNLVHIRLVEEYERLQRADARPDPSRRIDVQA